jgi:cytochrome c
MRLPQAFPTSLRLGLLIAFGGLWFSPTALAVDAEAAKVLARQSNCFKCHAATKKKDGPSFHDTAVKYKGKPEAVERLTFHITSGEKAKFDDGHEEEHPIVKTKDKDKIKNLVDWILSL